MTAFATLTTEPIARFAPSSFTTIEQPLPSPSFVIDWLESPSESTFDEELSAWACPWCGGSDLHELPRLMWCKCCEEPAWYVRGEGLVRADQLEQLTVAAPCSQA